MIEIQKIGETQTRIILGWTPVPGCIGYVFYADGLRVSNTWDPMKSSITFSKGPKEFKVVAVGQEDSGVYPPPVAPPPADGLLKARPPGFAPGAADPNQYDPYDFKNYPGFVMVAGFPQCVDSTKDYFIPPHQFGFKASRGQGQGRSVVVCPNGRNVVAIGSESDVESVSVYDDASSLTIHGENPAGHVYLEGVEFSRGVNIITDQTSRAVTLAYCRIGKSYVIRNDHITGGVHPDVWQKWDTDPSRVTWDWVTVGYTYQDISMLLGQAASFRKRFVNVRGMPLEPNSIKIPNGWDLAGGTIAIFAPGNQQITGVYSSEEQVWCLPGDQDGGASRRLQDVFDYGASAASSTVHAGPGNPTDGNLGRRQGDYITFSNPKLTGERWTFGLPSVSDGADSNGDFVPSARVGIGYAPVGYV